MTNFKIVTLSRSVILQASRGGATERQVNPNYFYCCLQICRKCFALPLEETLVAVVLDKSQ